MQIAIVYAGESPASIQCDLPENTTVEEAICASGILCLCPDIDLSQQKVGVFGKFVSLDKPLEAGERVEIYQRITRVMDDDDEDEDD